jgi:ribonuclease VapC
MIVDSSVLIAIVFREVDRELYIRKLATTEKLAISASTLLESRIVAQRSGFDEAETDVLALIDDYSIDVIPFSQRQQEIAADAHRTYGRGTGHPARLNFGDCFAYALAKESGEPLLFKGDDFSKTDIKFAL